MAGWVSLLNSAIAAKNRSEKNKERYNLISSSNYFEEQIEFYLDNLSYDHETNFLSFNFIKKTTKPKITRYVTQNYERTPIYGDISVSTKIMKKFNKVINPIKFLEEDILNLDLDFELVIEIINEIGYIPTWREKQLELEEIENKIKIKESNIRSFKKEKRKYNFKIPNNKEIASNFWIRLFFAFFTFGLSFSGYISKKEAARGLRANQKIKANNEIHRKEVDLENEKLLEEIEKFNKKINKEKERLIEKYNDILNQEISPISIDEDGWINLREAANFSYDDLKGKKGVYIIWNKTKDIYYVGQSKNMKQRLNNHFSSGTVKNIIFAKDWYENDDFYYKYFFCGSKDELDSLERKYIQFYDSFENGYNKTGGNL